jgi:virulence factor Mce-like protein
MRNRRTTLASMFDNPVMVGTVTILVVLVAVYLSYIAENGLPFIPTYNINVQVADGGELNKNVAVRIGGDRVGQVLKITAEPANRLYPHPYAQLELALDKDLEPLPATTRYQVRLASVLGGQYVELFPGRVKSGTAGVPDGGTLALATRASLNHNIPYVDFSQALDVFGPKTEAGIRSVTQGLGNAFAGRGTQINDAIVATAHLLRPLQNVLNIFSAPHTQLGNFIDGVAATTSALEPVANTLVDLLNQGATTFKALDVPALGTTLNDLPSTETIGTAVLNKSRPVLAELASITQELRPAARYLPTASKALDTVLRDGPTPLKLLTPVSHELITALGAARNLAKDPAATEAFTVLGVNDLGTTGSSAFIGLGAILNTVGSQQLACNIVPLWVRNFASTLSEGNADGNWLRIATLVDPTQLTQSATGAAAADLHIDTDPTESTGKCVSGNETYVAGHQNLNQPVGFATSGEQTQPPTGVLALGEKAGLVPTRPVG